LHEDRSALVETCSREYQNTVRSCAASVREITFHNSGTQ